MQLAKIVESTKVPAPGAWTQLAVGSYNGIAKLEVGVTNEQMISIRSPVAEPRRQEAPPPPMVGKALQGLRVGIRKDRSWLSWLQICEEWSDLLRKDGAEPVIIAVKDHLGPEGERTRSELQEWTAAVDCAVVGLAN